MRLIGITGNPTAGRTWVAGIDGLDPQGVSTAQLIAPVEDFWRGPGEFLASPDGGVVDMSEVRRVPPVLPQARVVCIGLNYREHVAEGSFRDQEMSPYPTLFARWTQSLSVAGVPIPVPENERGLDWEGEIAAWVGRDLCDVSPHEAREAVLGYSTFNDVTARIAQKLTSQWILGKNADFSGPLGPLVTRDEVGDLRDGLRVRTRVNGDVVQDGSSDMMTYEVGETLAHISRTFTLRAGDILATGTPSGVGYARTPEWLLHPGDTVEVEVERLGTLANPICGPDGRRGNV